MSTNVGKKNVRKGSEPVQVRLKPDLLDALDRAVTGDRRTGRAEVMRLALEDYLIAHRYLETPDATEED